MMVQLLTPTSTLSTTMHGVTDRQVDGRIIGQYLRGL